ncbi:ricin-type beta-trefoil lectin domain protein [Actinacidiphila acidipaludis]|uniref:Ricin-type beta-trefoil lectin domain protein n=1 Tax=Actinacidiphila acidipaludis TaxID=2873382 RepID=A0ABS7QHL8_9ACTN|nr:ricin-type beta-trefoil lectin domain protein [Streptomyces acidipaludis]MBY8882657.1 ricin-type beta-trefoil lectin domain protein [Streptomyces acidipaludis]
MRFRNGIAPAATTAVALAAAFLGTTGQAHAATALPAHFAAPYLQIDGNTANDMASDMNATGLKYYTLAFLIPRSGCTAQWEASGDSVGAYTSQINALKSAGGTAIISFGGAEGGELAQTCTSVSSLTAAYANIVNTYGITRLDFDIEGGTLGDSAANQRRNQALAALQAQNPSVQVAYTLAVDPGGLPSQEYGVLSDAKSKGVNVSAVNIMTMDFGDGENALADAESAARGTASQLAGLYGISTSAAYNRIGLTPIAGQNDDNEYFSQSDAQTLESFAASNGVQELAFWEVDYYDKPAGYAYSRIFNQLTTGSTGGGGTGKTGQISGYGGKCVDVAGASSANGAAVQLYDCNGTNAQQWTVASNGTLQALGKCMDITAAGTANGTQVQLYDCNGTGAQVWQHQSNGELINPASGKCLDATGPSSANGTRLQIWTCYDSANQQWSIPS